ncbi:hypothetical protein B0I08_101391 [Glaciihabitans tibetensis]|uniref:Uncharacterized protein n=1 Tax=Glaciihabitans tibetensis TaxID=1266600 RepID=A0A2T0VJ61_9MICO|nr:hypothetical protein [Glaciihabitans tibetensis]PRY70261.1 hypothetical protein B0I08_101391 [Glaciihabitans tibetensis]
MSRAYLRYSKVGNALMAYAPALESAQRESADALLSALRLRPAHVRQYIVDMRTPVPQPTQGMTINRLYGNGARPDGRSWSSGDPSDLVNPRMQLGLPNYNLMERVAFARIDDISVVEKARHALPYNGNLGGAPEYLLGKEAVSSGGITVIGDLPFVLP